MAVVVQLWRGHHVGLRLWLWFNKDEEAGYKLPIRLLKINGLQHSQYQRYSCRGSAPHRIDDCRLALAGERKGVRPTKCCHRLIIHL